MNVKKIRSKITQNKSKVEKEAYSKNYVNATEGEEQFIGNQTD
eukprot:CAMPEP_0170564658 /NCGR_PEP_ID=MMETSP0211-20121228/74171_1 /TAXON_ID=311385 /ORGANISM="Pseudokeronopsis sp., Strain OXSARD2" /LENGTH=42 /DNA_ID= /DNA_START= /DNA_END= /DNA_ORIENTATION=